MSLCVILVGIEKVEKSVALEVETSRDTYVYTVCIRVHFVFQPQTPRTPPRHLRPVTVSPTPDHANVEHTAMYVPLVHLPPPNQTPPTVKSHPRNGLGNCEPVVRSVVRSTKIKEGHGRRISVRKNVYTILIGRSYLG